MREEMINCGHHFHPNGDLQVSYARERQGVFLHRVVGFRGGEKVLVDSWCEPRCPECGCPSDRYHHPNCEYARPTPPPDPGA